MKHFPSLLPGLFVFAAAAAQVLYAVDTNTPAVDAKALGAFMQKWHTDPEDAYPDTQADWPLLLAALAKDHLKDLERWLQEVRDGKVPDDPKWR